MLSPSFCSQQLPKLHTAPGSHAQWPQAQAVRAARTTACPDICISRFMVHHTHTCKAATWEQHSESQGWEYYLDRESFFICSADTAFVLPRGSFWGTPQMTWDPNPVTSLLSVTRGGSCPTKHRIQQNSTRIFSACQWNADNMTVLRGGCYCRQLVLLYYCSLQLWQSRQRAALTGLNFPVSSVTSWELISTNIFDSPPLQSAHMAQPSSITLWNTASFSSFSYTYLFQNYCKKMTNNNIYNIREKNPWYFCMILFSYRQTLNSCFSEETAGTQQDLIHLECRAACNNHKIKTHQWRNHLRCLEET